MSQKKERIKIAERVRHKQQKRNGKKNQYGTKKENRIKSNK